MSSRPLGHRRRPEPTRPTSTPRPPPPPRRSPPTAPPRPAARRLPRRRSPTRSRPTDAIIERAVAESGLPEGRITGELGRTTGQLRMFAAVVGAATTSASGSTRRSPTASRCRAPDLRQRMIPLGPVAVFGASNFPLAFSTAGGDTASALAAGCPVVVKGHPAHPGTGELVARAITRPSRRAACRTACSPSLLGDGSELGQALVADPRIKAVGFTGSRARRARARRGRRGAPGADPGLRGDVLGQPGRRAARRARRRRRRTRSPRRSSAR